jgi:hypothetical protein
LRGRSASVRVAELDHRDGDHIAGGVEFLVNADVEPDADRDGFGDETQDQCPTNASTQGSCPPAPAQVKPCQGLTGKKLKNCRANARLKAKLARCRKLKGKKARVCARRARALARCSKLKNKNKRAPCKKRARRIR